VSVQSRFREEPADAAAKSANDDESATDATAPASVDDASVHEEPASFDTMDFDPYE